MEAGAASATSSSLLGRLRAAPTDETAWKDFVRRYGGKIYGWCRQWALQAVDAEDVTQNVLLTLAGRLRTFDYDPARSFRAWLRTVTRHAVCDFLEERRRADPSGRRSAVERLEEEAVQDDLLQRLQDEFDLELFEEAMTRVQSRLAPHRWEAFRLTALEGLSGAEVATRLQMKVATVFAAKSTIHELLRKELRRLEAPDDD
jgi:RNA polymerase sigma-70 factor (ECF subfamily)